MFNCSTILFTWVYVEVFCMLISFCISNLTVSSRPITVLFFSSRSETVFSNNFCFSVTIILVASSIWFCIEVVVLSNCLSLLLSTFYSNLNRSSFSVLKLLIVSSLLLFVSYNIFVNSSFWSISLLQLVTTLFYNSSRACYSFSSFELVISSYALTSSSI